jgi:inosose dehydratase
VVRLLREVGEDAVLVLADENGMVTERVQHAGRIEPGQSLSPEQWEVYARNVDSVARIALEESGISTVFHHHCGGFVETPWEIDALMERTDPDMVGLCLDTGHLEFGGGDSMACLEKWRARIRLVHFKDCDTALADKARKEGFDYFESVRSGVFCELGKGGVAFEAVMKELVRGGYHGWLVVEQDVLPGMGTPLESARRNRQFLEGLIKSSGHC